MTQRIWVVAVALLLAPCSGRSATTSTPPASPRSITQAGLAWLDRPGVVTVGGGDELIVPRAPADTTYDLRSWAYQGPSGYPFTLGEDDTPLSGVVTVGGSVSSDLPDESWDYLYHENRQAGDGIRVVASDWTATFDLTLTNVWDGYNPRVQDGTEQDNHGRFVLSGCYFNRVHDDAVENDDLMSGTVQDCLLEDVFVGFSEEPSSGNDYTNHGSVLKLRDVIARFSPYVYGGVLGTGKAFKWSDASGTVNARDCIFAFDTNTNQSEDAQRFPAGTYDNVTIVLGADFEGSWPVALPAGVTVTRDWSVFTDARDAWLLRMGYPAEG